MSFEIYYKTHEDCILYMLGKSHSEPKTSFNSNVTKLFTKNIIILVYTFSFVLTTNLYCTLGCTVMLWTCQKYNYIDLLWIRSSQVSMHGPIHEITSMSTNQIMLQDCLLL